MTEFSLECDDGMKDTRARPASSANRRGRKATKERGVNGTTATKERGVNGRKSAKERGVDE